MRRTVVVSVVILLVGAALPTSAEARRKSAYRRQVDAPYVAGLLSPSAGIVDGNTCFPGNIGCVFFETTSRDAYVKISIVDDVGEVVAGTVLQAGREEPVAQICGSTGGFVPIEPGLEIAVSIQEGECGGQPAVATRGKVIATFTDVP